MEYIMPYPSYMQYVYQMDQGQKVTIKARSMQVNSYINKTHTNTYVCKYAVMQQHITVRTAHESQTKTKL